MTVSTTVIKGGPYSGNDSTTAFSTIFQFRDSDELIVIQTDASGTESTLILDTDYTVSGGAGANGTVTLTTALPTGETLLIIRDTDDTQGTDFDALASFDPEIHEEALDRLAMRVQELEEKISRSARLANTASAAQIASMSIPISTTSKFLKIGDTGLLELAVSTDGSVTIDRSTLGALLFPQNTAESDAGVTPTDYGYDYGKIERYGVVADGVTDDTAALADALAVGYQGQALDFGSNKTIITDPFTMSDGNSNVPIAMVGYGITLKAPAGSSGVFITLENPHDAWRSFVWSGAWVLDSNSLCTSSIRTHGCQDAQISGLFAINSVGGPNWLEEAEASYGIFYNTFLHCRAGDQTADGSDDDGFSIKTTDGSNRIAANTRIGFKSNWNEGAGFDLDRCSDTFVGHSFEKNDGNGFDVDNCTSLTLVGGYSENNHLNMSGGGASDASTDVSLVTTANSNRVMVFGGRHVGEFTLTSIGTGQVILPGQNGGTTLTGAGMAFNGESLFDNFINFAPADGGLRVDGDNSLFWDESDDEWEVNDDFRFVTGPRLDFTDDQSTVGSAGGASALPATPTGYVLVNVDGTERAIPYYDES